MCVCFALLTLSLEFPYYYSKKGILGSDMTSPYRHDYNNLQLFVRKKPANLLKVIAASERRLFVRYNGGSLHFQGAFVGVNSDAVVVVTRVSEPWLNSSKPTPTGIGDEEESVRFGCRSIAVRRRVKSCVVLKANGRLCCDPPLGALTELRRPGLTLNSPQRAVRRSGAHFVDNT